jgi:hypothetical protein
MNLAEEGKKAMAMSWTQLKMGAPQAEGPMAAKQEPTKGGPALSTPTCKRALCHLLVGKGR